MVAIVTVRLADDQLNRWSNIIGEIGEGRARKAMVRAVNRTVDMVFTRVVRSLVKQTSAPRKMVVASLKKRKASHHGGAVEGAVVARGGRLSLKYFKPVEVRSGTEVTVMGGKEYIEGAFFKSGWAKKGRGSGNAGLGNLTNRRVVLGGHVYKRTSKDRTPIEKQFGPSIPAQMVDGATAEVFRKEGAEILQRRVSHEMGRMLAGAS